MKSEYRTLPRSIARPRDSHVVEVNKELLTRNPRSKPGAGPIYLGDSHWPTRHLVRREGIEPPTR